MTRITRLETLTVEVATRQRWLLVRLTGDDGNVGLGEATDSGAIDLCDEIVHTRLASRVVGQEAVPNAVAASLRLVSSMSRSSRLGGLPHQTAASAVEMATWDLAARAAGARVVDLLGGPVRDRVPVYGNLNRGIPGRSAADAGAAARLARELGIHEVKLAPFDGIEPGLPRRELVAALGAAIERIDACIDGVDGGSVLVDAHGRFDRAALHDLRRAMADRPLGWVEEPVRWEEDPEGLRAARAALPFALAAGELLGQPHHFRELFASGVVDVVMADVKHCGGIGAAYAVARQAEAFGIPLSLHNPSGPVATAASLHVAAACGSVSSIEFAVAADRTDAIARVAPNVESLVDGRLVLPAGPGLGVELDADALTRAGMTVRSSPPG